MKAHTVPRDWPGATVAIVASGPSVNAFDFERIAGLRTIAVKDGYLKVPHAEVLIIGDHRYERRKPDLSGYKGPLILYTDPDHPPTGLEDPRMRFIPKVAGRGLSRDPTKLRGTFTTVALAINYAVLRGASKIVLVGVDAKAGPNNERHFTGTHKEHWHERYNKQKWGFSRLPDDLNRVGVKVWNLNPDSAVRAFEIAKRDSQWKP